MYAYSCAYTTTAQDIERERTKGYDRLAPAVWKRRLWASRRADTSIARQRPSALGLF